MNLGCIVKLFMTSLSQNQTAHCCQQEFYTETFSIQNCVKMNTPYWFVGEYYDSCRSVVREIENNQRLLRIIQKNGLQVLSADEQHYFWDNLNEFREEMFGMNQFLSDVNFPENEQVLRE